ncbi:MAG: single-stranded DNA-binding protein [Tissierellia bacterium]|jgi:single-strand DNA-binding protein|nr:single-stranded DNA-binding protein [Tissierellia bacterium]
MNQVVLIGRLTRDPELRFVPSSGKAVANFTLAVNRVYSKEKEADFFRIVVWGKQAENVATYLKKGSQCAVSGSIHNNNYTDRDGNMRYSTDIQADRVEFLSSTSGGGRQDYNDEAYSGAPAPEDDFPMIDDDDVPF